VKNVTPFVGDLGSSSSKTASVDEVGESPGWIYDPKTSGSLCLEVKMEYEFEMVVWLYVVLMR